MNLLKKLFQMMFVWNVKTDTSRIDEAQALVAITFGLRGNKQNPQPGRSNEAMAEILLSLQQEHGLPLIVQNEICRALQQHDNPVQHVQTMHRAHYGNIYCDTYLSAFEAALICSDQGFNKVAVVAHPAHAWRVCRCLEKFGLEVVAVITDGIPYDPESSQRWCSSPWRFIPYEIFLARPAYLLRSRM